MPGHTTERLVVVATHPHGVLHRGERKCAIGCSGRHRRHDVRLGSVLVGADEQRPCLHGGGRGERGEVDIDTATTPPTGERHHPNRVETLADEVAAGVDGIGADAE